MSDNLNELIALNPLMAASITAIAVVVVLLLISTLVLRWLANRIERTHYKFDTLLVASMARPSRLMILALGLLVFRLVLIGNGGVPASLDEILAIAMKLLLVLAFWFFVDGFASGMLKIYSGNSQALRDSRSILQGIVRGVIIIIALLVILGTLGISITPLIASLGITSLAVALALQPTLENFFSGVQLVMDKPIRVGDFIELDSGEQGFVDKIGWRSTWIRMLPNNTVIMPNSKLSQSKVINYFYPEKELSVPVDVGVHYSSDLEHVERVTLEVAREILKSHKWGVDDYDTFVVYHTFDNSSINFTVMLRAKEYFNRFWVKSAFIKALHKRYNEEGIVIPFPITALNTSQEEAVMPVRQE